MSDQRSGTFGRSREGSRTRPPILALDGGGSKIDAALIKADGTVLGAARWSGSVYDGLQDGGSLNGIARAVKEACRDAGRDPDDLPAAELGVYCVAGADFPEDDAHIAGLIASRGLTETDVVRNDTFAVLRAGTDRGWGIAVVCGSGINCVGVAPNGETVRFPALGLISGDLSDSYLMGAGALGAAVRAGDGRGPRTALERLVPEYFSLQTPMQVVEAIHFGRLREDRLVELTPVVFAAVREGDEQARNLLSRQVDEAVAMAGAAIRRLHLRSQDVDVVLGGGMFRNDGPFVQSIGDGILAVAPRARIAVLDALPVLGAGLIGLDHVDAAEAAKARLRSALTHARLAGET
ncbi:MAG: N-acetylglucosamine kinase [Actinomycetota bacterium]